MSISMNLIDTYKSQILKTKINYGRLHMLSNTKTLISLTIENPGTKTYILKASDSSQNTFPVINQFKASTGIGWKILSVYYIVLPNDKILCFFNLNQGLVTANIYSYNSGFSLVHNISNNYFNLPFALVVDSKIVDITGTLSYCILFVVEYDRYMIF